MASEWALKQREIKVIPVWIDKTYGNQHQRRKEAKLARSKKQN